MSLTRLHQRWIKSGKKHKGIEEGFGLGTNPSQPGVAVLWQDFPCPVLTGVRSNCFPPSGLSPPCHCSPPLFLFLFLCPAFSALLPFLMHSFPVK